MSEDYIEDAVKSQIVLLQEERVKVAINKLYNEEIYKLKDLQTFMISFPVVKEMVNSVYKPNQKYVVLFSIEIIYDLLFRCNVDPSDIYFVSGSEVKAKKFSQLDINNYIVLPHETFDLTSMWWDGEKNIYDKDNSNDFVKKITELMTNWIKQMTKDIMDNVVIIGNPPYNGENKGAITLYDKFIDAAIDMKPKSVCMIVPSKWLNNVGKVNDFYRRRIEDKSFKTMKHFSDAKEVFPDANIQGGGVNWFVYEKSYNGLCNFNGELQELKYALKDNSDCTLSIFEKVKVKCLNSVVSSRQPFALETNHSIFSDDKNNSYPTYFGDFGKRFYKLVPKELVKRGKEMIDKYKVCIPYSNGNDEKNTPKPEIIQPGEVCSGTFLVIYHSSSFEECVNFCKYMSTKFFQFLFSQNKNARHIKSDTFKYVPVLDFTKSYSDADLFEKFDFSNEEVEFVNSTIKENKSLNKFFQSDFVNGFDIFIQKANHKSNLV